MRLHQMCFERARDLGAACGRAAAFRKPAPNCPDDIAAISQATAPGTTSTFQGTAAFSERVAPPLLFSARRVMGLSRTPGNAMTPLIECPSMRCLRRVPGRL